jgi:sensor histidine kinase YesM
MSGRLALALRIVLDSVLIASLVWVVLYSFAHQPPPASLLPTVLVYTVVIAVPAHVILGRVFPLRSGGPAVQWTLFVVMLAAIAAAGSFAGTAIVVGVGLEPHGVAFGVLLSLSMRLAVCLALLVGVVEAMLQRLRDRLHATETRLHAQALENERALKLASEARLAALEARVQPHFLFNALNTISSLIPEAPERAERLVERMAAVLRFSLDAHNGRLVPMEQEIRIVGDYLEIERARFGDRLQYTVDVDAGLDEVLVPPFAVQTLVENSVKFAVAPDRKGGEIRVRAWRDAGRVRVEVADTGPGFSADTIPAGHGLDILQDRLALTFGAPETIRVSRAGGWTTVGFEVPG